VKWVLFSNPLTYRDITCVSIIRLYFDITQHYSPILSPPCCPLSPCPPCCPLSLSLPSLLSPLSLPSLLSPLSLPSLLSPLSLLSLLSSLSFPALLVLAVLLHILLCFLAESRDFSRRHSSTGPYYRGGYGGQRDFDRRGSEDFGRRDGGYGYDRRGSDYGRYIRCLCWDVRYIDIIV